MNSGACAHGRCRLIEGCAVQTETVLRQALAKRVIPNLFVNQMDRCILELQMELEDMYNRFRSAIENDLEWQTGGMVWRIRMRSLSVHASRKNRSPSRLLGHVRDALHPGRIPWLASGKGITPQF